MRALAGTGTLIRFILRRDRRRLIIWVAATVGLMAAFAATSVDLFPTPESLQARATVMDSPIGVAFSGPRIGLDNYTYGAYLSNEYLGKLVVALALMSVFLVVRNTRLEEQTGRSELVRANPVGRHAPAAAAMAVVVGTHALIGVLLALILPGTSLDLSPVGSWLFSAAAVATGVFFAALTLLITEVTGHSRTAVGLAAVAVGVAFMTRALGDISDSALSMLSPIGWAQATRPFVDDTPWPLLLLVLCFFVVTWASFAVATRRDVGEGLLASKPGPREASPNLARPLGLAWNLQRGVLIGWGVGIFGLSAVYGRLLSEVEVFVAENPAIEDALAAIGEGGLAEAWASWIAFMTMALVASYAVQSTLRLRSEETGLRVEQVLATPVERWRWMGSHLMIVALGSTFIAILAGFGFGLSAGTATGDWSWIARMIGATTSHLPSVVFVAGFAVALFGLLPRLTYLAWVLIAIVWIGWLGVIAGLPEWVSNLSPFGHGSLVPADGLAVAPFIVISAIAMVMVAAGFSAFQRRDIATV